MKKIISIVAILSLLSGCSLFGKVEESNSLTGILTKQESSDSYNGTHILTTEDGALRPVKSTALNLSNPQYIGNKVTLLGEKDSEDVFDVTSVSILEVLAKETTPNFATYMNQDFGFKIKYYDNWTVDVYDQVNLEEIDSVTFQSPDEGLAKSFVIIEKYNESTLDEATVSLGDNYLSYYVTDLKIGVNQNTAKKYVITNTGLEALFLTRDKLVYSIKFEPSDEKSASEKDSEKRTFNEMVAEFQFVPFNTVETPDDEEIAQVEPEFLGMDPSAVEELFNYSKYSEFESLPYKFKAKYPSSWYYSGSVGSGDVLHRYSFSNEPVTPENEIASLEVVSGVLPSITRKVSGEYVDLYVEVASRVYRIHGKVSDEDILKQIAASISPLE